MAAYLPDVFLLSVFRKLSAEDRVSACQVCTNWYHRVREVNKAVQCLTIEISGKLLNAGFKFASTDHSTHGYNPKIKQHLNKVVDSEMRKKIKPTSKLNTLKYTTALQLNSTTIQQIITAFPFTTELNLISRDREVAPYAHFAALLENDHYWSKQLTAVRLIDFGGCSVSAASNKRLFTAINSLPKLEHFALEPHFDHSNSIKLLPEMPVFSHLNEVRFDQWTGNDTVDFLRSVSVSAANNANLRIDIPDSMFVLENLLETNNNDHALLNHLTRERIIRVNNNFQIRHLARLQKISTFFPNLTSISVTCSSTADYASMLDFMSQSLHKLLHLKMNITFSDRINLHDYSVKLTIELPICNFFEIEPMTRQILNGLDICKGSDIFNHRDDLFILFGEHPAKHFLQTFLGISSSFISKKRRQKTCSFEKTVGELNNSTDMCSLLKKNSQPVALTTKSNQNSTENDNDFSTNESNSSVQMEAGPSSALSPYQQVNDFDFQNSDTLKDNDLLNEQVDDFINKSCLLELTKPSVSSTKVNQTDSTKASAEKSKRVITLGNKKSKKQKEDPRQLKIDRFFAKK